MRRVVVEGILHYINDTSSLVGAHARARTSAEEKLCVSQSWARVVTKAMRSEAPQRQRRRHHHR